MCSVSGRRLLYSHRRLHACQPPCSPTPAPLLPDSLRIFLALMRCPVKSRNGNNLRAKKAEPRRRARILVRFDCDLRWKATNEMTVEVNLVFCVLVVLTGSSRTRGQSSVLPPVVTLAALPSHTGSSASPHLTEGPGSETSQWTHYPASRDETSAQTTTITRTKGTVHSETNAVSKTHLLTTGSAVATSEPTSVPVMLTAHADTPSPSAAADGLSLTLAFRSTTSPQHPSVSSQADVNPRSTVYASTFQPRSESLITAAATGHPLTSAAGRDPAGPTHQDVPSVLNVGDEDPKRPRPRSPLDPLLAGLMSVFIVTTAIFFIILFLRFRQRTNHPEFHRLQDLPMDDLMEDTPLSRYTY